MSSAGRQFGGGKQRRGYILLAVIVCTLIAGLVLVSVAQHSLQLATEALRREESLQQRWGAASCHRALLPVAAELFTHRDLRSAKIDPRLSRLKRPPARIAAQLQLGRVQFDLLLADEDAKVNLNTLYEIEGRSATQRVAQRSGALQAGIPIRLLPATTPALMAAARDSDEPPPAAFRSWGEVFDLSRSLRVTNGRPLLPMLTANMSCWGHGVLNVRRAGDETIVEVCRLVIPRGQARQLVDELRDNPRQDVRRLIEQLGVVRQDQNQLQQLLGQNSACFSLWLEASAQGYRYQRLIVSQTDEYGGTSTREFE